MNLRKEFRITDLDFAEKYELFSELQQVMEMYECPELARHVCVLSFWLPDVVILSPACANLFCSLYLIKSWTWTSAQGARSWPATSVLSSLAACLLSSCHPLLVLFGEIGSAVVARIVCPKRNQNLDE